jgi:SAM-dependent methyltransferase
MIPKSFQLPDGFQWHDWIKRWDKMQERYIVRRSERIELLAHLISASKRPVEQVLDLGCGTGSLMQPILDKYPDAEVYGIDFDPLLLPLAQERLRSYGNRVSIILADLRSSDWQKHLPGSVDAVISATALHWLTAKQLSDLYHQLSKVIRPGGLFLNADHVSSQNPAIQRFWEQGKEQELRLKSNQDDDDWDSFWVKYTKALGLTGLCQAHKRVLGGWEGGIEEGLPLEWHFSELIASGFTHPECFWRCDCDAIYGAFRGS